MVLGPARLLSSVIHSNGKTQRSVAGTTESVYTRFAHNTQSAALRSTAICFLLAWYQERNMHTGEALRSKLLAGVVAVVANRVFVWRSPCNADTGDEIQQHIVLVPSQCVVLQLVQNMRIHQAGMQQVCDHGKLPLFLLH